MADNTSITPGTGESIASDDIGGVKFQRIKVIHGPDGTNDGDVSSANPLPAAEPRPATSALSNVASSATSVTLLSANAARKQAIIVNDSTQVLYVKFGTTASATSYTYKLAAGDTLELPRPIYTGRIDGIWASANGNARVTEIT